MRAYAFLIVGLILAGCTGTETSQESVDQDLPAPRQDDTPPASGNASDVAPGPTPIAGATPPAVVTPASPTRAPAAATPAPSTPTAAQKSYAISVDGDIVTRVDETILGERFVLLGFVKNVGSREASGDLTATFRGANGQVLGSYNGYLPTLAPDQRWPFRLETPYDMAAPASDVTNYSIRTTASGSIFDGAPAGSLRVAGDDLQPREYGGWTVRGEVFNDGDAVLDFVKVAVAFYDAQGQLADVGDSYASIGDLHPGISAPFEVSSMSESIEVARHEVFVAADVS